MASTPVSRVIERKHIVVLASLTTQFMTIGGMFAYGVFFTELEREFGWSRTLLSAVSSASVLVMGVLAMFVGQISDRYGPRWVLTFSGLMYGIGYTLIGGVTAPWQLLVLFGVFVGIGLSTHDVVTLSTIARWFPEQRGKMTGIVKVGTAGGQIVMPLLATTLIAALGWRTACIALGITAGTALVLAAQGMRAKPALKTASPGQARGLAFRQITRTRQFWTMCAIQFLFFPTLTTIPVHIVVHGTDLGLTTVTAAAVLSVIAASSILGRLTIGPAIDRIGGRRAYTICFSLLITSLLLIRFTDLAWLLFVFAGIYGIAHGGLFTLVAPTIAEYFGLRAHGSAFGVIIFFGTIGGSLGPVLAGRSFDATGTYHSAFTALITCSVVGLILARTLTPIRVARRA